MASIIRKIISTTKASKVVAPYNQAIVANQTVYVSGCLGLDKNTNKLVNGGAKEQTEKALENLVGVLEAAGSGVDKVVKNTIFMKDLNDFATINDVYKKIFNRDYPARTAIQIARLPMDALVEIECIALVGDVKTQIVEN